jgi:hypothetical protein
MKWLLEEKRKKVMLNLINHYFLWKYLKRLMKLNSLMFLRVLWNKIYVSFAWKSRKTPYFIHAVTNAYAMTVVISSYNKPDRSSAQSVGIESKT